MQNNSKLNTILLVVLIILVIVFGGWFVLSKKTQNQAIIDTLSNEQSLNGQTTTATSNSNNTVVPVNNQNPINPTSIPVANTLEVSNIVPGGTAASLKGSFSNVTSTPVKEWFQYGKTTALNSKSIEGSSAKSSDEWFMGIYRLTPNTTYYYQFFIQDNNGNIYKGTIKNFVTTSSSPAPLVLIQPASSLVWTGGNQYVISWTSGTGSVTLTACSTVYRSLSSQKCVVITSNQPATGSYTYNLPYSNTNGSADIEIRVTDSSGTRDSHIIKTDHSVLLDSIGNQG
jgi:hypothetical protein